MISSRPLRLFVKCCISASALVLFLVSATIGRDATVHAGQAPTQVNPERVQAPRVTAVQAAGTQKLSGHIKPAFRTASIVSKFPVTSQLNLAIALPLRNQAQLNTLLAEIYNPHSPQYRHYLTVAQFAADYGPTQADYEAVINFVQSKGLKVTQTFPSRVIVDVSGTAAAVQSAFYVTLNNYKRPDGTLFYAPDREPSLDLSTPIFHITGLDNYVAPHSPLKATPLDRGGAQAPSSTLPHSTLRTAPIQRPGEPAEGSGATPSTGASAPKANVGSAPFGLFGGNDFRTAYAPGVALNGGGQCEGLLEFDGFFANDVTLYKNQFGLPNVSVQTVLLNGFNGSAGANNVEVALDIDMAISMAPGLSSVVVFEGTNTNSILGAMASPPSGVPLCNQLSASWNFGVDSTSQLLFDEMAAQGQSYFVSSGDSGAYQGDPGDDRDEGDITVVGGTVLAMNGNGASWQSEATWPSGGGGILSNDAIPGYQATVSMSTNNGSNQHRDAPDVSMIAQGVFIFANNGQQLNVSGTSISSPLWAGYMSLANQQAQAHGLGVVGFANPAIYAISQVPSQYGADFHDIQTGNNSSTGNPKDFSAVAGYDLATGWGSPRADLINDLSPIPVAPPPTFSSIEFDITTGGDDLRGDSSATVSLLAPNGSTMSTFTLKAENAGSWDNNSVHNLVFPLSSPQPASAFGSFVITLTSHNGTFETDDNWNIQDLGVRLVNTNGSEQCMVSLSGNPLTRLTGSAPSQPYAARSGCP